MAKVPFTTREERAENARAGAVEALRDARDRELRATDWTQLPDAPVKDRQEWAQYRQALRDLPGEADGLDRAEDVRAHPWPTRPDEGA